MLKLQIRDRNAQVKFEFVYGPLILTKLSFKLQKKKKKKIKFSVFIL